MSAPSLILVEPRYLSAGAGLGDKMAYEIWLTAICIITTALGMLLAWSWGYKEGKKVGYRKGRSAHPTVRKTSK